MSQLIAKQFKFWRNVAQIRYDLRHQYWYPCDPDDIRIAFYEKLLDRVGDLHDSDYESCQSKELAKEINAQINKCRKHQRWVAGIISKARKPRVAVLRTPPQIIEGQVVKNPTLGPAETVRFRNRLSDKQMAEITLGYLSGDLNYDGVAKAKKMLKRLLKRLKD